jgi:hypothetical protein
MEQTIWQAYRDDGVIVWGINFAESVPTIEEFIEQFGVTFPILLDPQGGAYSRYLEIGFCVIPFPLDHIVDPDGLIAYRSCEYYPDSMVTIIDELLEGQGGPPLPGAAATDREHARLHEAFLESMPRITAIRPNPIHERGVIEFTLPARGKTVVDVLDVSGRRLRRLVEGLREAGPHVISWDGLDDAGRSAPGGIYLLRMSTPSGGGATGKVLLIR